MRPVGHSLALERIGQLVPSAARRQLRSAQALTSRGVLFVAVAALAVLVRLLPLLIGGGLESYGRYDDGVYYAASDALTFGHLPYRNFVLLHPPGIVLVLTPFALLGRLTSDPVGMAAGRLAFIGIGALNAVLVAALAGRWSRPSALAGGVLYACWLPAVYAEQSTMLEPLGTAALLIALLLLVKTTEPPTARGQLMAGVALGLACAMKIWYVGPWAVVVLCLFIAGRRAAALRNVAGGAAALAVVLVPFFVLAPTRMYDMVVRDQLLRPLQGPSRAGRVARILGIRPLLTTDHPPVAVVVTVLAAAFLVAAAITCWVDRSARIIVAVLTGNLLVLLASPSYFPHYAALTAAPAVLVLAVALGKFVTVAARDPRRALIGPAIITVSILAFLASGERVATLAQGDVFPRAAFNRADPAGCVTADDPTALIEMNRLSRDFSAGCRVPVDVTGIAYDRLYRPEPPGDFEPWYHNTAFRKYLHTYLLSGHAFVITGFDRDGIPPATARSYLRRPRLALADDLVLFRGTG
jgi:alpha-1,2-mannosyltransferase